VPPRDPRRAAEWAHLPHWQQGRAVTGFHVNIRRVGVRLLLVAFTAMPCMLGADCRQVARAEQADANMIPPASSTSQERTAGGTVLTLPGHLQAWHDTPIYARVKGYLKQWYVDFGASVKAGQLLAEIDTPDLDANLEAAEAKLRAAKAMVEIRKAESEFAKSTYERWHNAPVGVVSAQGMLMKQDDFEIATAHLHTAVDEVAVAESEIERLRAQLSFKRITSPFDGVLIERNVDIGVPVSDSCGPGDRAGGALFRVIDPHKMRVFVKVPQDKSGRIEAGLKANLTLPQFPGKVFPAVVVSNSHAIDEKSETLLVELDVDNPDGALQLGSRGQVQIELAGNP
jgi:RND family efflux transporter MFP subunit